MHRQLHSAPSYCQHAARLGSSSNGFVPFPGSPQVGIRSPVEALCLGQAERGALCVFAFLRQYQRGSASSTQGSVQGSRGPRLSAEKSLVTTVEIQDSQIMPPAFIDQ
ncbi:hypothetical protein NQZ68_012256 [Dissostichus eleginoides]|nr:hypothetical protein NQZ68_012256 [Dissostichus eleginoides]